MPLRKQAEVEGQTSLDWGLDTAHPVDEDTIRICRTCGSSRTTYLTNTVDPRWVYATCHDCGRRVIADVVRRTPKETHPDDCAGTDTQSVQRPDEGA